MSYPCCPFPLFLSSPFPIASLLRHFATTSSLPSFPSRLLVSYQRHLSSSILLSLPFLIVPSLCLLSPTPPFLHHIVESRFLSSSLILVTFSRDCLPSPIHVNCRVPTSSILAFSYRRSSLFSSDPAYSRTLSALASIIASLLHLLSSAQFSSPHLVSFLRSSSPFVVDHRLLLSSIIIFSLLRLLFSHCFNYRFSLRRLLPSNYRLLSSALTFSHHLGTSSIIISFRLSRLRIVLSSPIIIFPFLRLSFPLVVEYRFLTYSIIPSSTIAPSCLITIIVSSHLLLPPRIVSSPCQLSSPLVVDYRLLSSSMILSFFRR